MRTGVTVHPSAVVAPGAELAEGVSIGAFCVIGAHVRIGTNTQVEPHCVIDGRTTIGCDNRIGPHASLGGPPQDKKYAGEPTELRIGNANTIREFTTFNTGTVQDGGITSVGDDNWVMAYVHVAHDCQIGSHTILANSVTLAGHVIIEDHAILGGATLVHQFCRIGAHAFTAGGSVVLRDVPPFVMAGGNSAQPHGINSEGLKRRGFSSDALMEIKRAYKTLYRSGLTLEEANIQIGQQAGEHDEVQIMSEFLNRTQRGIVR